MNNKVLPILVSLLVIAAFIGGSQWTVWQFGKQVNQVPKAGQQGEENTQPEESEAQVLGEQSQQAMVQGATVVKGNPGAKVTIVEFSEYQCPYCARYANDTLIQIMNTYGDNIYYVWRDLPLGFHQNAVPAALAARCAGDQGKYWEMHDQLFINQADWTKEENPQTTFANYALAIGLDVNQFTTCVQNQTFKSEIENDLQLGRQLGVQATPTFFINGQKVAGAHPFEVFKAAIEKALSE